MKKNSIAGASIVKRDAYFWAGEIFETIGEARLAKLEGYILDKVQKVGDASEIAQFIIDNISDLEKLVNESFE